jgi:hypothetical protein
MCVADGTKLKPMIIFKWKTAPKIKFLPGILVHFHEKGWIGKNVVKLWMKMYGTHDQVVYKVNAVCWCGIIFHSHVAENIKNVLARNNTEIVVITGGLTSVLQPLDVCLNKPFKDHMCEHWNNWMMSGEKSYKKGGAMHAASLDVLCDFVIKSWEKVKVETMIISFKKCGIFNALDGTKDDFLWDTDDKRKPTRQIQNWTHVTTVSTVKVRTYLRSSLPRMRNVMILQDFKYISK